MPDRNSSKQRISDKKPGVHKEVKLPDSLQGLLGKKGLNRLVRNLAKHVEESTNDGNSKPRDIARSIAGILEKALDGTVCMYNPASRRYEWYNTSTKEWIGPC